MMRNHRLICGDYMLAIFQRGPRQINGNALAAANHFNNHIDIITRRQLKRIVMPVNAIHGKAPVSSG